MSIVQARLSRRRFGTLAAGLLSGVALSACGGGEDENTGPSDLGTGRFKDLYEAAKAEGKLVLYSTITAPQPREAMVRKFEQAFPGIKVEHIGKPGQGILEQFQTERRAGLNKADVLQYPGMSPFMFDLQKEGFLLEFTPSSADKYPREATVPGYGYPSYTYQVGVGYNPTLVKDAEVEKLTSYASWTDAIFSGRANIVGPSGGTGSRALFHWATQDPNLGWSWLGELAALKPAVFNSITPASERLVAGEYGVSFNQLQVTAGRYAEDGAPYRVVFPKEYVIAAPVLLGIGSKSANPNAAKLFIEWALTEEGQRALLDATKGTSLREGMRDVVSFESDWYQPPSKLVYVDEAKYEEGVAALSEEFGRRFGSLG